MHFTVSSVICFDLDQSKNWSSGNMLNALESITGQAKMWFELVTGFVGAEIMVQCKN